MRVFGILLFFAALCLPMIQSATGWLPELPIDENRVLAPWPKVAPLDEPVAYFTGAEAWFDDRFGLRDPLIRLKTQIDYSVFDTSTRVHVGKDGWLFYRSVLDVEKPATERYLAANADLAATGIAELARGLKTRNVRLILMPLLLGDTYYPEKLPRSVPNLPEPSRFALAMERWRSIPDILYFDSASILRDVQRSRPIFYRTDFHWNEPAAFEVAHALVDMIAGQEGMPGGVWDHRLEIERRHFVGKESDFLPLFVQPSEEGLFVAKNWSTSGLKLDWNQGIYEWIATQTAPTERTLPSLCVVGDSFFDGLYESGIMTYFRHVYRIRWQSPETLDRALEGLPPDCRYLLVEFIETQIPALSALGEGAKHLTAQAR